MFLKRHYEKEIMDDFSITDERVDAALKELNIINKYLGGNSVSLCGINILINPSPDGVISILDIGSGGSDLSDKLKKIPGKISWTSVDMNIEACRFEKKKNSGKNIFCADAMRLPFRDNSFDIVHASLFLHHFTEKDISFLVTEFRRMCRRGVVINDLRRNTLALSGIRLLTQAFSRSSMVKNDGPLSVKRGFVKGELVNIISKIKFRDYIIKRKWAFRWLVYAFK